MKSLLFAYLVCFVLDVWPKFMVHGWQRAEVYAIAHSVTTTDGSVAEDLRLMQIAGMESGFWRKAKGPKSEVGPWQLMPPAPTSLDAQAQEALRRMRYQGMMGYVGCGGRKPEDRVVLPNGVHTTCQEMVDHRVGPADAYPAEHRPPPEVS